MGDPKAFVFALVDRIGSQWDAAGEVDLSLEDFANLLKRSIRRLPETPLRAAVLVNLPLLQKDAWLR